MYHWCQNDILLAYKGLRCVAAIKSGQLCARKLSQTVNTLCGITKMHSDNYPGNSKCRSWICGHKANWQWISLLNGFQQFVLGRTDDRLSGYKLFLGYILNWKWSFEAAIKAEVHQWEVASRIRSHSTGDYSTVRCKIVFWVLFYSEFLQRVNRISLVLKTIELKTTVWIVKLFYKCYAPRLKWAVQLTLLLNAVEVHTVCNFNTWIRVSWNIFFKSIQSVS